MQIIDNLSIFQALVFILTNESIIKQKRNITRTTLFNTGVPQRFDEMSTLVRAVQEPPDIHSKL